MEERNDKNNKIEIVKGDPKKLHISDVKDNLLFEVKENKKKNIIIPENQKNNTNKDNDENNNDNNE